MLSSIILLYTYIYEYFLSVTFCRGINIYKETADDVNVTDTLVTKILLGVLGITPAYDRYFKIGCQRMEITPYSNFSINSYKRMVKFYLDNIESFNQARDQIENTAHFNYPPMKLVDMYFWSIGANA